MGEGWICNNQRTCDGARDDMMVQKLKRKHLPSPLLLMHPLSPLPTVHTHLLICEPSPPYPPMTIIRPECTTEACPHRIRDSGGTAGSRSPPSSIGVREGV